MSNTLTQFEFVFPGVTNHYHGKVRDVYTLRDNRVLMVVSDRISAFDHVLPAGIPYKGQVLNQLAAHFLKATSDIVPNWLENVPDPNVSVGQACKPIKIEMVIRGYLVGHAWREYRSGKRELCGVVLPEGMRENEPFPEPIITPATKAEEGHDEDISREDIIKRGIVLEKDYVQLEQYTRALFRRGTEMARERGLILVDTKYEFGYNQHGEITLIDEIHTPDSSRYFYADGFEERLKKGERQKQLSKEFVREWLIANDFQGLDGQKMPEIPKDFVQLVSERYIELYEKVTGTEFEPAPIENIEERVRLHVEEFLTR